MKKVFGAVYRYCRQTDFLLILLTVVLAAFGALMVYSATRAVSSSRTVVVQAIAVGIGFVAMIVVSKIDYHTLTAMWKVLAVLGVTLLVLTLLLSHGGNGTDEKAWIQIGKLGTVQPSEIVKLLFILTLAKHVDLVKDDISRPRNVLLLTLHAMIPVGLIALEKDYGMACVFLLIFICVMFAANLKLRYFAGTGIALLALAPILWLIMPSKPKNRILVLFNPDAYSKSIAYQQLQSRKAIGSGELFGYGLFHGPITQSVNSQALPERQNDMIFAVIGEELGFIGCIILVVLLVILLVRLLMDSRASKDLQGSVICIGVFAAFAFQTVANIGMCLLLIPVIGLTLPFISSGGTSVISCFLAVGMVQSVYRNRSELLFTKPGD